MKNKYLHILLVTVLLIASTLACNLPVGTKDTTDYAATAVVEVLSLGWRLYTNQGVQIMLPTTYELGEIETDVPGIQSILEVVAGTQVGTGFETMISRMTEDVRMWGTNTDGNLTNPTRILIMKNDELAKLPLALISLIDPSKLSDQVGKIEETKLTLGGREVLRVIATQAESAEAIYLLKDSDKLWIIGFITTSDRLVEGLTDFDKSVETFRVISVE
jgi:hypothetical protein